MKVLGLDGYKQATREERATVEAWLEEHNLLNRGIIAVEEGDGETICWSIRDETGEYTIDKAASAPVQTRITVEATDFPWPSYLTKASA